MKKSWAIATAALCLAVAGTGRAFDTIVTTKVGLPGNVVGITAAKVEYEQAGAAATRKEVPVNQVLTIYFDEDPKELKTAKEHVLKGNYAEAATALARIKKESRRKESQQDVEYYRIFCAAKLALAGNGNVADLARTMKTLVDANPNSYHYFEASELVGELLLAAGQYAEATEYYGRLAKAPWPDYQMRAGVAAGRALLARGKTDEALVAFNNVLAADASGELAQTQRWFATLGKARVFAAQKKSDEAIKLAEEVLQSTSLDDKLLRAQAYNVEGAAHRQAGRATEALLAFLQVDFDYSSVATAHAEALANLAELWEQQHKIERAQNARKTLEERYKDSPWAKRGDR